MVSLNNFIKVDKGINLIYGESATGKTTIGLIKAIEYCKKGKVVFIDTENGFSLKRFEQLAGTDYKKILENLFLFKIKSFKDQQLRIKNLENIFKDKIDLVIVDTMCYYYRRLVKSKSDLAKTMLKSQLRILNNLNCDVLITNQVYTDINDNKIKLYAYNILKDYVKVLIRLEKNPRKIILEKPENKINDLEIVEEGVMLK